MHTRRKTHTFAEKHTHTNTHPATNKLTAIATPHRYFCIFIVPLQAMFLSGLFRSCLLTNFSTAKKMLYFYYISKFLFYNSCIQLDQRDYSMCVFAYNTLNKPLYSTVFTNLKENRYYVSFLNLKNICAIPIITFILFFLR